MKRQRLQHQADILAHMACGWRVVSDLQKLAELRSGRIEIDALTGQASILAKPLSRFMLGEELAAWLARDGQENDVPPGYIRSATVTLDFTATIGEGVKPPISLARRANSVVVTDERTYTGTFNKPDEPPYLLPRLPNAIREFPRKRTD